MPNITTNHAITYTNLFMFGGSGGVAWALMRLRKQHIVLCKMLLQVILIIVFYTGVHCPLERINFILLETL